MNATRAALALCFFCTSPALAAGDTPPAPGPLAAPARAPTLERTRVALRLPGALAAERRGELERVLRAELEPHGVTLVVETTPPAASARLAWVQSVRSDPQALLAAVLEVGEGGAELYVVDAARGRAIVRRLPGAVDDDAALPEAVASILESAVAALREGLEVASEPVEAVVAEPAPVAPVPAATTTDQAPEPPPPEPTHFAVRGGIGANVATLGEDAIVGGNLSAVVRLGSRVATRLGAALFVPDRVTGEYGDFRLRRATFDLRFAWLLAARPFTLMPELGAGLELVSRTDATPHAAATAAPDTSHWRGGGVLGMRATVPIAPFVAFDAGVHADYYTRAIDFVAGDAARTTLATLGNFSVGAEVGVLVGGW
ncbi:MAG TPA: hypothetical protein VNN72_26885 [Polyangiaceae bacterium]|nr:hypothetical protein [Polyangiaceae bacterium]